MEKEKHDWKKEWQDMPEFIQEDKGAIKRVYINFLTKEDIDKFNELTGLKITMKTKGVFFPKPQTRKLEWRDES